MVATYSEKRQRYWFEREQGLDSKQAGKKLNLPDTTRNRYENDYQKSLVSQVVEGTTIAVKDTLIQPVTQWKVPTILIWMGIIIGIIVLLGIIGYGLSQLWSWYTTPTKDDKNFDIKNISKDVIERVHSWYAEDLKKKELELERSKMEIEKERKEKEESKINLDNERIKREELEKELDEIKRICSPPTNI
jgi:hypothetical protein